MATLNIRNLTDGFNPEITITPTAGVVVGVENGPALTGTIRVQDPSLLGSGLLSSGVTVSVSAGRFGTLVLGPDTNMAADVFFGSYTYTPNDRAREGEVLSDVFTVTAVDGAGRTVQRTFSLAFTGKNDQPVLTALSMQPAAVVETAGTGNTAVGQIMGAFTVRDVDVGDTLTASVVGSPAVVLQGGGALPVGLEAALTSGFSLGGPLTATGNNQSISYTYDPRSLDLNFLAAGQTLTVTYTVRVTDNSGAATAASADQAVTFTFVGTNDAPLLATPEVVTLLDTVGDDDFTQAPAAMGLTGTLAASDVDGGTLVYGIDGGTVAGNMVTLVGQYGTLTVNTQTGDYAYVANDAAVEGLAADAEELFTVTVNDGIATTTATLTVDVTGVNDNPVLVTPGATTPFVENNGVVNGSANPDFAPLMGNLTVSDAEVGSNLTAAIVGTGGLFLNGVALADAGTGLGNGAINTLIDRLVTGKLTFGNVVADGSQQSLGYTYDATNPELDFLRAGQTLEVRYQVQVSDGAGGASAVAPLVFSFTGTNDIPTVAQAAMTLTINAAEAPNASAQVVSGTGTVRLNDRDRGDTLTVVAGDPVVTLNGNALTAAQAALVAPLVAPGALTFDPAGQLSNGGNRDFDYTYSATADLDFLAAGDTLTITYALRGNDGTANSNNARNLVITITGTNDGPELDIIAPIVFDDTAVDNDFTQTINGVVTANDPDSNVTYGINGGLDMGPTIDLMGTYGTLSINKSTGAYTFTPNDAAIEAEAGPVAVTFDFTVNATDGSLTDTKPLTIIVNGANDTAEFTGNLAASLTEDDAVNAFMGDVDVADRDAGQSGFVAADPADLVGDYGTFTFDDATGAWTYTLDNGNLATNALAQGEMVTDTLTITSTGGTTQDLVVTITGANDAPTLAAGPVYSESGVTFTVSDPDNGAVLSLNPNIAQYFSNSPVVINDGTPTELLVQPQPAIASSILAAQDEFGETVNVGYLVLGTDGNDGTMMGFFTLPQAGAIYGFGGDDYLIGSVGDDAMFGGADNDTIDGFGGLDSMYGGAGDDRFIVAANTAGAALFDGGDDTDTLDVTIANFAPTSDDQIQNVERITLALGGANTLNLSNQTDGFEIIGNAGVDNITGSEGHDVIDGGNGNDVLNGGGGDDTFVNITAGDTVNGGDGDDTVTVSANYNSTNNNRLVNVEAVTLTGAAGLNVTLAAQDDGFRVLGTDMGDTITGSSGDDVIDGGAGADSINAGNGTDTIVADEADTLINGGGGQDTLLVRANFNNTSNAQVTGIERVEIDSDAGVVLNLGLQTEGFAVLGDVGDDTVTTGSGADDVSGGGGNDTIAAGNGSNTVTGGAGNDVLSGGTGVDRYVFEATGAGNGTDTINGFSANGTRDILNFAAFLDENGSAVLDGSTVGAPNTDNFDPLIANTAVSISNRVVGLIDIADGQDLSTAAGLLAALNMGGEFSNLTIDAGRESVVLTAASNAATTFNAYFVSNDGMATTVELVGVVNITTGNFANLQSANFTLN